MKITEALKIHKVYEQLKILYNQPDRHYHNMDHIFDCLTRFNEAKHLAKNPGELEIAIWFHDAIYNSGPGEHDNEGDSAKLSDEVLSEMGISRRSRNNIKVLILATKHIIPPFDNDAMLIVDIDLASLGYPREIFEKNSRDIRKEYSWVEEGLFWRERTRILKRFLDRKRIYLTDFFYERYEDQARINITRTLTMNGY